MNRNIFGALIIILALGLTSCESYFGNINENPNRPTKVSVDVMLPALQVEVADIYGGDFSRFASLLTQHAEGVARQWSSMNNYSGYDVPANFNTAWVNTYANILNEALIMKEAAEEEGSAHYVAAANLLIAFHLMNATDVWGDIPYSDAFQGVDNISSSFDSQESLYNEIFSLLDAAIAGFNGGAGARALGGNDLYYGGDAALWAKAAHGVKARAYLHLGLVDASNYTKALSEAAQSFADASEDFTLQYGAGETEAAQWYRFNRDRTGDIEFHPTMRAYMTANADSFRMNVLDQTFNPAHPFLKPDYNQGLVTYRELKFLEAEALMASGGSAADIHAAFVAGVNAAFDYFGTGGAAEWLANNDPGVGNVTMNHIISEKGVALYGGLEPYNDLRRTGFPVLTPNDGNAIPTRLPYGDSEILFNTNTPTVSILTKVWWDN